MDYRNMNVRIQYATALGNVIGPLGFQCSSYPDGLMLERSRFDSKWPEEILSIPHEGGLYADSVFIFWHDLT